MVGRYQHQKTMAAKGDMTFLRNVKWLGLLLLSVYQVSVLTWQQRVYAASWDDKAISDMHSHTANPTHFKQCLNAFASKKCKLWLWSLRAID